LSENCEVAVLGAGPAGSTLAALLALRGISVALIDRDEFPRDKVCGEFLSYDALPIVERLGVLDLLVQRGAPAIRRCRLIGRRRTYEFALPQAARGVSRMLLDETLLRRAIELGAQDWSGWTATALDTDRRGVTVVRNGDERQLQARVIVGAWGRWGRFDQLLDRPFVRDKQHRNFGFKRHYRTTAAAPGETIDLYSFSRGYLGVNDVEGGITNICGLVHADRLTGHRGRWETFVETLRAEEPSLDALYSAHVAAQDGFLTSEPVIFHARGAVERGVFLVGDASGIIDPLTGNGMAMAMQSAVIAASAIASALAGEAARTNAQVRYAAEHGRMFARRIAWSRRIAAILSRPRLVDSLINVRDRGVTGRLLVSRTRADRDEIARLCDRF
jgi:flavin-dependent dehydrogenase